VTSPALAPTGRHPDGMTVTLLALGAVGEAATGLVLMTSPSVFIRLLIGAELSGAGVALGRLTGFALLALGVACWPGGQAAGGKAAAIRALLTYSLLATAYLLALGLGGELVGRLLWPAVVVHAIYALLLARAWFSRSR
jgi:hypothetical protein